MKIIAAAFIALLTTFPCLQAIQKNIEIKRQEFFFDAKAWLPAKSFSSQNDELCTVTHRKMLNLKLSLNYNSQSQELLIENTGGGSVKYLVYENDTGLNTGSIEIDPEDKHSLNTSKATLYFPNC